MKKGIKIARERKENRRKKKKNLRELEREPVSSLGRKREKNRCIFFTKEVKAMRREEAREDIWCIFKYVCYTTY